jgi:signal transduction histidine kinase
MKTLFKSLKFRLITALGLILFALFYGFGYIVIHTLESSYKESLEASLFTVLKDIRHDYTEAPEKELALNETKEEFELPVLFTQIVAYDSMSNKPHILNRSNDLKEQNLPIELSTIQQIFEHPNDIIFSIVQDPNNHERKIYMGTMFLAQKEFQMLFLQCALPYNKHTPQIQDMIKTLWIGLCTLLFIILGLAYVLISKSLANVLHVTNVAKTLHGQIKHSTIPKSHIAYEIDDLIETFNTLLSELQHAYAQVQQFGQNASHELKTPLTIIKGEIEIGLRKERSPKEYVQILEKVGREVGSLHEVIEKILFLSSSTKNDLKKHFHELYVDEVLLEAIEEKRSLAEQKQIALSLDTLEPQNLRGNAALLKIAIANLIDNAIKYSPAHSTIHIALKEHELSIRDEGMGMSEEEMEHIFEQFYRTKESQESTKGSGLGLCIVKNILDLHDLTIHVQSDKKQGTDVRITF